MGIEPVYSTHMELTNTGENAMTNTEFKVGDQVNEYNTYHKNWSTVVFEIIKITKSGRYALGYRKADGVLRNERRAVQGKILRRAA